MQPYIQTGPAREITDPDLANLGLRARGRLRGAPRVNDQLFLGKVRKYSAKPRNADLIIDYKRRPDGRSFFETGRVSSIKLRTPEYRPREPV
jgi:hypothetical protein